MIVKIHGNGKSFADAANYLTHDPGAQTTERIDWTHTLNCADTFVPCAVNEMLWTARDAELLKQEAGVRGGGRQTEEPVKTFSLNWAPGENPSQEHMIATMEDFLRHMGWQEHQVLLVAHNDKSYRHVHGMLNMIHPETGLRLDDDFERRKAQRFALEYERTQGHIYCAERLKGAAEREQSMPRNIWMAFQQNEQEFARAEKSLGENQEISLDNSENRESAEWKILKKIQHDQRKQFLAEGKFEFSALRKSVYREVREEFRERWADYFEKKRGGLEDDDLAALKKSITADQTEVLGVRRDAACAALRTTRDSRYRELLDEQKEARAELRWRLELGLDNADFLSGLAGGHPGHELRDAFRDAAHELTSEAGSGAQAAGVVAARNPSEAVEVPEGTRDISRSFVDAADEAEDRALGAIGGFFGSLFEELINLGSPRQPLRPERDASGRDPFKAAAEETLRQQQHRDREEEETARQRRQRIPYAGD